MYASTYVCMYAQKSFVNHAKQSIKARHIIYDFNNYLLLISQAGIQSRHTKLHLHALDLKRKKILWE